jgi:hypothetical protein
VTEPIDFAKFRQRLKSASFQERNSELVLAVGEVALAVLAELRRANEILSNIWEELNEQGK